MNKTILPLTAALLLLTGTNVSVAAVVAEENKQISQLAVEFNGNVAVLLEDPSSGTAHPSCFYGVISLPKGSLNFDSSYSMLLAAKVANRPVTVEHDGCVLKKVILQGI